MTRGQRTTQTVGGDDHFAPDFEYWRRFATLKVWEIAYLMMGVDPRRASDYVVQDREDPTGHRGVAPDISDDERMLASAIDAGLLRSTGSAVEGAARREVVIQSLIPWLMANGHARLAGELRGAKPTHAERCAELLARLRELGGDVAKDNRKSGSKISKINELARDLRDRKQPLDVKTIRTMLREAASEEAERTRAGESEPTQSGRYNPNNPFGFGPRK
jgi:hypothetical protein